MALTLFPIAMKNSVRLDSRLIALALALRLLVALIALKAAFALIALIILRLIQLLLAFAERIIKVRVSAGMESTHRSQKAILKLKSNI